MVAIQGIIYEYDLSLSAPARSDDGRHGSKGGVCSHEYFGHSVWRVVDLQLRLIHRQKGLHHEYSKSWHRRINLQ
jgi:hypothetical protein